MQSASTRNKRFSPGGGPKGRGWLWLMLLSPPVSLFQQHFPLTHRVLTFLSYNLLVLCLYCDVLFFKCKLCKLLDLVLGFNLLFWL